MARQVSPQKTALFQPGQDGLRLEQIQPDALRPRQPSTQDCAGKRDIPTPLCDPLAFLRAWNLNGICAFKLCAGGVHAIFGGICMCEQRARPFAVTPVFHAQEVCARFSFARRLSPSCAIGFVRPTATMQEHATGDPCKTRLQQAFDRLSPYTHPIF